MLKATHRIIHNVASLYAEDSSSSEQVSQLVWGSAVLELATSGDFSRVVGEDLYEGWVRTAFLTPLKDDPDCAFSTIASLFAEVYASPTPPNDIITRLTVGARVVLSRKPSVNSFAPIELPDGRVGYVHESQISALATSPTLAYPRIHRSERMLSREEILKRILPRMLDDVRESSLFFIGVPYLWGGTTPFGLDCSGFTQLLFKISGVQLPRDASMQWKDERFTQLSTTSGLSGTPLERSDLIFFGSDQQDSSRVRHVGLALGDGRFIHCAGKGRGTIITPCSDSEFGESFVGASRLTKFPGLLASHEPSGP